MKTSGLRRTGIAAFIVVVLAVLSVMTFVACSQGASVEEITVDEATNHGVYKVSEFASTEFSKIELIVKYENVDEPNRIALQKSMLTTEDKDKLSQVGEQTLTINYKGKTAVLAVTLVEEDATVAMVTFRDQSGTELGVAYTLAGSGVKELAAPVIAGKVFSGWVDADGKKVDLTKVSASVTVFPNYVNESATYTYRFVDHKGTELSNGTRDKGEKISSAPSVSLSSYPELASYSWSETLPYTVESDVTIKLVPVYKQGYVRFIYALDTDRDRTYEVTELNTSVQYGDSVSSKMTQMERTLTGKGFEIVTRPTQSATINLTSNGQQITFMYVVKDASVTVELYNDAEGKTRVGSSTLKAGESFILPTTAASVRGSYLCGWKIKGNNGEVTVLLEEHDRWTVTQSFGLNVKVTPVYAEITVPVSFRFVFYDVNVERTDENYELQAVVNGEFAVSDVISYDFVDYLLDNIKTNKDEYIKLLSSQTSNSTELVTKEVSDNSSEFRSVAFEEIEQVHISVIKLGADEMAPGGSKVITTGSDEFVVTLSKETVGMTFDEVTDDESGDVIGYAVSGFDSSYVEGTNVYVPATHTEGEKTLPVVAVKDGALVGKTIIGIASGIRSIGESAFENATVYGNVSLPELTVLGDRAFYNATFVASEVVLGKVKAIGESAFANVHSVDLTVNAGTELLTVGDSAFLNASGIVNIVLPETTVTIGDNAFCDSGVLSVQGLDNVTTVGEYAFKGVKIGAISLPKVKTLGAGAFVNDVNLVSLSLGADGDKEDGFAFDFSMVEGSKELIGIEFGAGLASVELNATVNATLLDLRTITVAEGNEKFFAHEDVLYSVSGSTATVVYYANNKTGSYKAASDKTINVDANAFEYATVAVLDLSGVTVGNVTGSADTVYAVIIQEDKVGAAESAFVGASVVKTGEEIAYAYDEESALVYEKITTEGVTTVTVYGGYKRATDINVPDTLGGAKVTVIADGAFAGYALLETLTIEATLNGWNATILDGDDKLTELTIAGFATGYTPALSDFENNGYFASHNVIFVGGKPVGYNASASINGRAITTVKADDAKKYFSGADGIPDGFFKNSNLTAIDLPEEVKKVGKNAFEGSRLASFTAVGLQSVGEGAFKGCEHLEEIVLTFTGTAPTMGKGVFENCTALKKATIKGDVNIDKIYRYLPSLTFSGCSDLEEVDLGSINCFSLTGDASAFFSCESLKSFDFSNWKGDSIPAKTFASSGLQYVILTNSNITKIGQEAFSNSVSYVKLGSSVTDIGVSAFRDCDGLVVELAYDDGGLYSEEAVVGDDAFPDSAVFYVTTLADRDEEFLQDKTVAFQFPTVKYGTTIKTEESVIRNVSSIVEITTKVFLEESDVVAPEISGYIFAGWYLDENEVTKVEFPIIITQNLLNANNEVTLYAKYYNENRGSVDAYADVKYVYYVDTLPNIDLDDGESVTWNLIVNGAEQNAAITKLPYMIGSVRGATYGLKATVSGGTRGTFVKTFDGTGVNGYALTRYSDNNVSNMTIPDTFDDGTNGAAPIIVLFAGAFREYVPTEFNVPTYVKAIMMGYGENSKEFDTFDTLTTFGSALRSVTVPTATTYIEDGVFASENVEEIVFGENSELKYATEYAFVGSKWWAERIERAAETNGFIMAGRLAVKFVGTADALLMEEGVSEYVTAKRFGLAEGEDRLMADVTLYYKDSSVYVKTVELSAREIADNVYSFDITKEALGAGEMAIQIVLNTDDATTWDFVSGSTVVIVTNGGSNLIAFSVATGKDDEVTVPTGTNKLGDGLFRGNKTMTTIVLNQELVSIGDEAFLNSGLTTIRYGAANEQFASAIAEVGKNVFNNTVWYKTEKVILGTMLIKYNNASGANALTITENITKIGANAFKGASNLATVTVSSSTVKEIGAFAFKASGIKSIILPRSVTTIGRGAFMNCTSLTSANFSSTAITTLEDEVFSGDRYLSTVALPDSVETFGKLSLNGCERLSSLTANGILELEVSGESYECGLDGTAWYGATGESEEGEDVSLILGNVLVKYIVGERAQGIYEETKEYAVKVPDGITMIAYNAFNDARNSVTEVVLPASVKEIGTKAFVSCGNLRKVTFGSGLTVIGQYAFDGVETLEEAILPENLEKIGDYAFRNTGLRSEVTDEKGVRTQDEGYTIPDSVKEIGTGAFYGANNLTVLNLGSKIESIGDRAFNLKGDIGTAEYAGTLTENDVKFYKVNWNLDVNPSVNEDGSRGLSPAEKLASTLAERMIGADVFATRSGYVVRFYAEDDAVSFTSNADLFNGYLAWQEYGWVFHKKSDYPQIDFDNDGYTRAPFKSEYIVNGDIPTPEYISKTNTYTFMGWTIEGTNEELSYPYVVTQDIKLQAKFYLNEIVSGEADGNGVEFDVSESNVLGYTGDTDVLYVPNTVDGTAIRSLALSAKDDKIKTLILTKGANFNNMTENVFARFAALEKIVVCGTKADYKVVPNVMKATYDGVEYEGTFYVVYSNDVSSDASYGTKLFAVIGNVDAASKEARAAYKEKHVDATEEELKAIMLDFTFVVPEGVTEICTGAFVNSKLAKVSLPATLTKIGDNAFGEELEVLYVAREIGLTDVTYAAIPESAPIMQRAAGSHEVSATNIGINGLRIQYNDPETATFGYFYVLANVLTQFKTDYSAFTALQLPTAANGMDVTVVASQINRNKSGNEAVLIEVDGALTLPSNVQKINEEAFMNINFNDLAGADGYDKLRDVASNVFDNTNFYENNEIYVGKILVKAENADDATVIRPGTIAIASGAFNGASSLTKITIPDSVVSIGDKAFYGCNNLEEVTIPNSVVSIGESAFALCQKLNKINIDTVNSALSTLGAKAFNGVKSLKSIALPYSLKSIGESAFAGCTALTSVTFDGRNEEGTLVGESKLEEIGGSAFNNDRNLTWIDIPDGVTVIKSGTFENCSSLTKITFTRNSKLREIEDRAFYNCVKLGSEIDLTNPSLVTVEMPNSLVTVGASAFAGCSGMWGISFKYNLASLGANVFQGCTSLAKVVMNRASAPSIEGTTFFGSGEQSSRYYKLRIYVQADETDKVKNDYINKWSAVFNDCADYIRDVTELPTVEFAVVDDNGETVERKTVEDVDVIVSPSQTFSSGTVIEWFYYNAVDGTQEIKYVHVDSENRTISVRTYGNNNFVDANQYILVADYDTVIVSSTQKTKQ